MKKFNRRGATALGVLILPIIHGLGFNLPQRNIRHFPPKRNSLVQTGKSTMAEMGFGSLKSSGHDFADRHESKPNPNV